MLASDRALQRIREEMTERKISQRDLASTLKCSQGRVAKILNGNVNLRVNDLETLAHAVGIRLSEAVRDRGVEFYAEMTPSEVRLLDKIRQRNLLDAVLQLVELPPVGWKPQPQLPRPLRGRPLKSTKK